MVRKLLLILSVIAVVLVAGCVSQETPTKAPDTSKAENLSGISTTQPAKEVVQTPTELSLKVGEIAKTSKVEVSVISAQKTKSYDYYSAIIKENMTQEAKPGKVFFLIDSEIKNVGADRVYVGSSEFSITDSEGFKYDPEVLYYGDDGLGMVKELYQNQKMKGKILFEVPENAKGLKLQYDFGNLFIGTKLASWTL